MQSFIWEMDHSTPRCGMYLRNLHPNISARNKLSCFSRLFIEPCFSWGLPDLLVTKKIRELLPHVFTLIFVLLRIKKRYSSLWHFPAGRPELPLAASTVLEVPTFLQRSLASDCSSFSS